MRKSISIAAALVAVSVNLSAQSLSQAGIPLDAQTAAMASTGVAARADGHAHWNNIASAAAGDSRFGAAVSVGSWLPELGPFSPLSASLSGRVGEKLGLTAGLRRIGGSEIPLYDEWGSQDGTLSTDYMSFGAGVAYQVMPGLSLGIKADYHNSGLGFSAVGIGLDGQYRSGGFLAGFRLSDVGSADLPSAVSFGASYTMTFAEQHALEFRGQAAMLLTAKSPEAGVALRYTALDMISLYAGYYVGDSKAYIPSHPSIGAGFRTNGIGIDAAYLIFPAELGNSFCLTLKFNLE